MYSQTPTHPGHFLWVALTGTLVCLLGLLSVWVHDQSQLDQVKPPVSDEIAFSVKAPAQVKRMAEKLNVQVAQYLRITDCDTHQLIARVEHFGTYHRLLYCSKLEQLPQPAFMAVIGHELSHIILDQPVSTPLLTLLTMAVLFLIFLVALLFLCPLVYRRLAWLFFVLLLGLYVGVMLEYRDDRYQDEYQADIIAAELTSPQSMIDALQYMDSHRLYEKQNAPQATMIYTVFRTMTFTFLASHPSYRERVHHIRHHFAFTHEM